MRHAYHNKHRSISIAITLTLGMALQGCASTQHTPIGVTAKTKTPLDNTRTPIGTGLLTFIASDGNDLEVFAKDLATGSTACQQCAGCQR